MGTWGVKLYQDDTAKDIRDSFKDILRRGKTAEEATSQLIADHADLISDAEDGPVFWFALADTQWELGCLQPDVKENALFYLKNGEDSAKWQAGSFEFADERKAILESLRHKLELPQPAPRRMSKYRLYQCKWKIGDVYAYPLESNYAISKGLKGRYFLLYKIGETTWYPGHIIPVVWVKITMDSHIPNNKEEFEKLEYVQIFQEQYVEPFLWIPDVHASAEDQQREKRRVQGLADKNGILRKYRLQLLNTSTRIIPKNIFFVENFSNITPPKDEYVRYGGIDISGFQWKYFEKNMIDRYLLYSTN